MTPNPEIFPAPGHEQLLTVSEISSWAPDKKKVYRLSHASVLWIKEGSASIQVEQSVYALSPGDWIFFSPYQPFWLQEAENLAGWALHFHYDLFCIEKYGQEVGCKDVLFNTPYRTPLVRPEQQELADLAWLLDKLRAESAVMDPARFTIIESYLKAFLVLASRIKLREDGPKEEPLISHNSESGALRRLIEENFREKRAPKDYADMLKLSPKALGRLAKDHWGKPLGQVLQERMMIEAKRDLYLTDKPVKRIARDLGFNDEYYFSRFFKKLARVSPQGYRKTVGEARAMAA